MYDELTRYFFLDFFFAEKIPVYAHWNRTYTEFYHTLTNLPTLILF